MGITQRRRAVRAAAAVLAAGMLVAACGSSEDSASSTSSSSAEASACSTAGESGTRKITGTFLGDVEVPASPKRVVAGWLVGTQLIDLGIKPVGMLDDYKANATPDELATVEGVPSVGSISSGVNTEQVLSLNPDLVVTMVRPDVATDLQVKELNEVAAPVAAFTIKEPTDVWAQYQNVADAVGCGAEAKERLAGLDQKLTAIGTDNADAISKLGTVAYVEGSAEPATYQLATNKSLVYERLKMAGLTYFDGVDPNPARYQQQVSVEDIGRLSSANVLFYEADYEGNPTERTKKLLDTPAFQSLPAVKAGNLFAYRTPYAYTTAAVDRQAEDIEAAVKKAKAQDAQ